MHWQSQCWSLKGRWHNHLLESQWILHWRALDQCARDPFGSANPWSKHCQRCFGCCQEGPNCCHHPRLDNLPAMMLQKRNLCWSRYKSLFWKLNIELAQLCALLKYLLQIVEHKVHVKSNYIYKYTISHFIIEWPSLVTSYLISYISLLKEISIYDPESQEKINI